MRKKMTKTEIAIRMLAIISVVFLLLSVFTITTYAYPVGSNGTYPTGFEAPSYNDIEQIVEMINAQIEFINAYRLPTEQYSIIGLLLAYNSNYSENRYNMNVLLQIGDNDAYIPEISEEWGRTRTANNNTPWTFNETIKYTRRPIIFDKTTGEIQISWQPFSTTTSSEYTYGTLQGSSTITMIYVAPGHAITTGINDVYSSWAENSAFPVNVQNSIQRWIKAKKALNGMSVDGYTQEDINNARMEGYDEGYYNGYQLGLFDGERIELDVPGIITAIPNGVKVIINEALDFEIFGINVAGTLLAILVVTIVAYIVKKVKNV